MKPCLKDMTLDEMKGFFSQMGEKPFRASQVFKWMYQGVESFDDMANISKSLRERLSEEVCLFSLEQVDVKISAIDGTRKYVYETSDGNRIESVFMKYRYGNSICVSSQAGCRMDCAFCASGLLGLSRNLTAGEMIDQMLLTQNDTGERIGHVVIMGTGEPFDNYENVKKFILNICEKDGLGISRRNITVSTCGLIPGMERFADELPQVNLAISLHGPNDEIRSKIMPVNNTYSVGDLMKWSRGYVAKTGRRITFEYALIKGINDHEACASELARRLKGMNCHVNLIPLNEVVETGFSGGKRHTAQAFMEILEKAGVQSTIRREMGADISAACGQLRLLQENR